MTRSASIGEIFGVELFEDSRLWRVIVCAVHYDGVDETEDPPFPLADLDDTTKTNANVVLYLLRQHRGDPKDIVVVTHRYFHRDSRHAHDGLDLKRGTAWQVKRGQVDKITKDLCRLAATMPLCEPVQVYDFTNVPSIQDAIKAFTKLPLCHTAAGTVQ
jgi:hypothetical protein